jgi:hypothetical protein
VTLSDVRPTTSAAEAPHLSQRVRTGLVLCILLGLSTVPSVFVPAGNSGSDGPPVGVLVFDVALGLVAIGGAVLFWRTGRRLANRIAAGALIVNAITALPAFFVDVDAWVKALVAVVVLLTVAAVVLQLSRPRSDSLG